MVRTCPVIPPFSIPTLMLLGFEDISLGDPPVCPLVPSYPESFGSSLISAWTPPRLLPYILPYSSTVPTEPNNISRVADTQKIPSHCLISRSTHLPFIIQMLHIHQNRQCGMTVKCLDSGAGLPASTPGSPIQSWHDFGQAMWPP